MHRSSDFSHPSLIFKFSGASSRHLVVSRFSPYTLAIFPYSHLTVCRVQRHLSLDCFLSPSDPNLGENYSNDKDVDVEAGREVLALPPSTKGDVGGVGNEDYGG